MTTEERLREAARYLRTQHPRPTSCGLFIDELILRAADEMDAKTLFVAQLALGTDDAGLDFEPWAMRD